MNGKNIGITVPAMALAIAGMLASAACRAPETGTKIVGKSGERGTYLVRHDGLDWAVFKAPALKDIVPAVALDHVEDGWTRVLMTWDVPAESAQDELSVRFDVLLSPDLWWAPHLSPNEGDIVAQHVFRSPALIAVQGGDVLTIVPDLALVGKDKAHPWFLDLDAPRKTMRLGLARSRVYAHVGYKQEPGMTFAPGRVELAFFVKTRRDVPAAANPAPVNPWSEVSRFLWRRYGHPLFGKGEPIPEDRGLRRALAHHSVGKPARRPRRVVGRRGLARRLDALRLRDLAHRIARSQRARRRTDGKPRAQDAGASRQRAQAESQPAMEALDHGAPCEKRSPASRLLRVGFPARGSGQSRECAGGDLSFNRHWNRGPGGWVPRSSTPR